MFNVNISDFFPSEEEIAQRAKKRYLRNKDTEETFSNWFPQLKTAIDNTDTSFTYPESKVVELPFEMVQLIERELESPDALIPKLQKYLESEFDLSDDKTYFIKTGVFSNKFDFKTCKLDNYKDFANQLYSIWYTAFLVGATKTNEVVVREYIEPVEPLTHIYNGMPLNVEFRAFVDIKGADSELIDVINYWHPTAMHNLGDEQLKNLPLEKLGTLAKELGSVERTGQTERMLDYCNYRLVEADLVEQFNKYRDLVGKEVLKIAKSIDVDNNEHLNGKWSIDVMMNGDKFYVIDAATMGRSALADLVKPTE